MSNCSAAGRRLVLTGFLGLVLVGCGRAPGPSPAASPPGVVPWLPLPAAHQYVQAPLPSPLSPTPVPSGTPPCSAAQLEAAGTFGGAATGHIDLPVILRNRGTSACTLEGFAGVSVVDAAGGLLAAAVGESGRRTFFADGPVVRVLMEPGTAPLVPGAQMVPRFGQPGQAWMNVEWYDCRHPQAARVLVDVPSGGGRLAAPFPFQAPYSPVCDSPGHGADSGLSRGPLSPAGFDWPPQPVGIPATVSIASPASVQRGRTLHYTVTIVNQGTTEYHLSPCPDYVEVLGLKAAAATYQLNCDPVDVIRPGGSATLEMRFAVPLSLAPGPTRLSWWLIDGRLTAQQAITQITVT